MPATSEARRRKLDPRIEQLLGLFDEAFDHKAWHGTNLRGSIRGLSVARAAWRPAPGRHNVWEVVVHAAYWKYAVRRRLTGEKRGSFAAAGSNWFERPLQTTDEAWRVDISLLLQEHRKLREVIARLRAWELPKRAGAFTNEAMIRGIAAHDLYHCGQIQLLKRLCPL